MSVMNPFSIDTELKSEYFGVDKESWEKKTQRPF